MVKKNIFLISLLVVTFLIFMVYDAHTSFPRQAFMLNKQKQQENLNTIQGVFEAATKDAAIKFLDRQEKGKETRDQEEEQPAVFFGDGVHYRTECRRTEWMLGASLDILVFNPNEVNIAEKKFVIPPSCSVLSFDWDKKIIGLLNISGSFSSGDETIKEMLSDKDLDGLRLAAGTALGREIDRYIIIDADCFSEFLWYLFMLQEKKGIEIQKGIFFAIPLLAPAMMEMPSEAVCRLQSFIKGVKTDMKITDILTYESLKAIKGLKVQTGYFPFE